MRMPPPPLLGTLVRQAEADGDGGGRSGGGASAACTRSRKRGLEERREEMAIAAHEKRPQAEVVCVAARIKRNAIRVQCNSNIYQKSRLWCAGIRGGIELLH